MFFFGFLEFVDIFFDKLCDIIAVAYKIFDPVLVSEFEQLFPHGGAVGYGWMAQDLAESGVVGDATNADSERGEEVVRFYGTQLAALLAEVSRADCEQMLRSRFSGQ